MESFFLKKYVEFMFFISKSGVHRNAEKINDCFKITKTDYQEY